LFALAQPAALRQKLEQVQRDRKLGKVSPAAGELQMLEILTALRRLGDTLSREEASFLEANMTESLAAFEAVCAQPSPDRP